MAKSAEPISAFYSDSDESSALLAQVCVPEDLAPDPEPRELSFGLYLRRERILRGISREEVMRVTKVSPNYVEALEANRFDHLPPKAFVVGFLRVFSTYAGLNSDEVVNRFLTEMAHKEAYEEAKAKNIRSWRRHLRLIIGISSAVIILALMFAPLFHR